MQKVGSELLHQEVAELTALLRHDPAWEDVRRALETKQLSPQQIILAGFFEDEFNRDFGVVVTAEFQIFAYERDTNCEETNFISWRHVADPCELIEAFPALILGEELLRHLRS